MDAPKTPESKRRANNKWDKANMATIACKIKKTDAEQFKLYAVERGLTPNALLAAYVRHCLDGGEPVPPPRDNTSD